MSGIPQALALRSEDRSSSPLNVSIAIVEGLRHLHLCGFANEEAQERCHGHSLVVSKLHRAVVVPEDEALLLDDVPQCKRGAQGWLVEDMLRAEEVIERVDQCDLACVRWPTSMGTLRVLEGPIWMTFRSATARCCGEKLASSFWKIMQAAEA